MPTSCLSTLHRREECFPFGENAFGGYAKKRYRFTGKERDDGSGLYYFGARYYAPWLCRFTSVDPLAMKYPGISPYLYGYNNPVRMNDPTGMEGEDTNNVVPANSNGQGTGQVLDEVTISAKGSNVYQINKETGIAEKMDISGVKFSERDEAKLSKGGDFIFRNNRLSNTSKETISAINNPSEAGPLTEFALGKLKQDFKTFEGNFPENYYEDFSKSVIEKSIELNGPDAGVNAAKSLVNKGEWAEGKSILHAYESYVTESNSTGMDKVQHFIVSASLQYNYSSAVADVAQYTGEVTDWVQGLFGADSGGFDWEDMIANNRGQAFGRELSQRFNPRSNEYFKFGK